MKKTRAWFVSAILLMSFLWVQASAADAGTGTLERFAAAKTMTASTFSDVKGGDWFFSGVRTAYDYAVMDGVGNSRFNPNGNVTKAQAVTIASRVHAIYYNASIADSAGGAWYSKYFDYANENGLLPPDITEASGLDSQNATRAQIAFTFSRILNDSDSARVCDKEIPDLLEIGEDFRASVETMYSSGIIGGKAGGYFDANGLATRAEIATIIGRIIDPTLRLASDEKYNSEIAGQEGNIQDYRKVLETGDTVFFSIWSEENSCWQIIRYDRVKKTYATIYKGGEYAFQSTYPFIGQMTVSGGSLYFVDTQINLSTYLTESALRKLDLGTLKVTTLYKGEDIQGYTVYGGEVYAMDLEVNSAWDYETADEDDPYYYFTIYKLGAGTPERLIKGEDFAYNLSGFRDRLYYFNEGNIVELDLSTKKTTVLLEETAGAVFCKNVIYYANLDGSIGKAAVDNLSLKKTLYKGDVKKTGDLKSLNPLNGSLYFNFDWESRIDTVNSAGVLSSVSTRTNHIDFGIFDGNYMYTDADGNDCILKIGEDELSSVTFERWISGKGSASVSIPGKDSTLTAKLSAEQVYAMCEPAVFRIETYDEDNEITGSASGFFLSQNGLAVTNYHAVSGYDTFKVILSDGREFWAETILGESYSKDITVFKVPVEGVSYLKIGDSGKLSGGQTIYTLGSPYGLESTISSGLVSNAARDLGTGDKWIQISAPISPGSSGGALLNEYGQVVGITTASLALDDAQNVNLALPINFLYSILLGD